jgi:hypothetical protein
MVWIFQSLLSHPSVEGYVGHLQILAVTNKAARRVKIYFHIVGFNLI